MKREGEGVIFKYTLSGEGRFNYGGRTHKVGRGKAFFAIVPGRHRYYYDPSSEEPWEFIWIRLAGIQAMALWQEWLESEEAVAEFSAESETIAKLVSFYESAAAGTLGDMWDISVRLYEWLLTVLKRRTVGGMPRRVIPDEYTRVTAWIEDHFMEDVALDRLAEMAGVTKHHFCKKFFEFYYTTPIQYVRKRRIEEAALLLHQSRIPIKDIAVRCGFIDLGYFGKVFHGIIGVSPSEYRRSGVMEFGGTLKLL
ncbi:hypothetical protein B1748_09055 [Paenibacillus sp. MY03]|uniref:AraC family transcriptional regulator n=1 Tax=Paenibacillus sp. MY03 TaxID=302980 RepID=UPI000B3CB286|nr:AraC family transcriptional regulator [Paenibacillus sp. MY03]OUS77279.1 hypothetical protein B1748_09055 [Paenibacillus sp. MY03]